jgi:LysM repeat protein
MSSLPAPPPPAALPPTKHPTSPLPSKVAFQLKILALFIALGFVAAIALGALYLWRNYFVAENIVRGAEPENLPTPDPGARLYEEAVDLLKKDEPEAARSMLFDLVRHFVDSARYDEAKRLIGELNADELLSEALGNGKKEYVVQRGDSLLLIANRNETTVDFLFRANGLVNTSLHPGDRLIVAPLSFEVIVSNSTGTVTLLRDGKFFREYLAEDIRLPPTLRLPALSQISDKSARIDGRAIQGTDRRYMEAERWLGCSSPGLVFRTESPPAPPDPALPTAAGEDSAAQDPPASPPALPDLEPGIILDTPDMMELFTLLRTGTVVKVIQ